MIGVATSSPREPDLVSIEPACEVCGEGRIGEGRGLEDVERLACTIEEGDGVAGIVVARAVADPVGGVGMVMEGGRPRPGHVVARVDHGCVRAETAEVTTVHLDEAESPPDLEEREAARSQIVLVDRLERQVTKQALSEGDLPRHRSVAHAVARSRRIPPMTSDRILVSAEMERVMAAPVNPVEERARFERAKGEFAGRKVRRRRGRRPWRRLLAHPCSPYVAAILRAASTSPSRRSSSALFPPCRDEGARSTESRVHGETSRNSWRNAPSPSINPSSPN